MECARRAPRGLLGRLQHYRVGLVLRTPTRQEEPERVLPAHPGPSHLLYVSRSVFSCHSITPHLSCRARNPRQPALFSAFQEHSKIQTRRNARVVRPTQLVKRAVLRLVILAMRTRSQMLQIRNVLLVQRVPPLHLYVPLPCHLDVFFDRSLE